MMPSRKRMMSAALLAVLAVGLSGCPDDEVNNVVTLDGSAVDTSTFPDGTSGDAAGGDAVDSDVPSIDVGADVPTIDVGADTPQADAPQADAPQADAPQADAPQADAPQADAPQADAPTSDIPVGDDASGDGSSGDGASGDEGTDVSPLGNIIEVATEAGNFTTLLAALDAAGLTSTFEGTDEYTVLAPTDDAFTAALATLGIDAPTLLADPGLADILTYHVLAGSVPASVVVTLTEATTLNGADVTITVDSDGNVFINDTVQVTVTDIPASNGIIHVLDGVLLPPEPPLGNIIEVATAAGNFTTLLAALDAAGLTSTFEGTDEYTVLAPTDDAFTALLATLGIDAPTLFADPGLADILTYHVLAGSVPASVVVTLTEATTLNGSDITITVDGNGNVFINDTVQVTVTDIPASNGIIHVLDGVLTPPAPPLGNIIEVATAAGNFTTLLAALDAAGLTSTFEGTEEYTVLAPTDDAFTALLATLGIDAPTLLADPGLADILTYHVLDGSVPASVVVTLPDATTLNGADITITVDGNGNVFINDTVQVTVTDIPASNGIIHVLDGVLLPPTDPPLGNIIEVATAAGNFTTLLAALDAAGLTSTFEGTDLYTVFAPTDDAFTALLATLGIDAPTLLADPGLADILLYHVISGASSSTDIAGEVGADTLNGVVSFNVLTDGTIVINGSVSITVTDVPASNGVIHIIDAVLLPTDLPDDGCCNANGTTACSASNTACYDAVVALDDFCASNFDAACNACAQLGVGFQGLDCSAAVDVCGCQELPLGNIIEVATAAGNFTTLLAALDAAGLTSTFEGTDEYTVLAPTDDAFAALLATLGIDAPTLLADPGLTDILTYHVLAGSVPASVVVTLTEATTLNGADITITVDGNGNVFINDSVQVTVTDIPASNGIIHVLDGVLSPPPPPPLGNIIEVATAAGNFTTLLAALDAAGLTSTFEGTDQYTVLAPTDDAFAALLATLGIDAPTLLADPGLADILLYHVISGASSSTDIAGEVGADTLNGVISLNVLTDGTIVINDSVSITVTDVPASNGVIHVIDAVLLPSALPEDGCCNVNGTSACSASNSACFDAVVALDDFCASNFDEACNACAQQGVGFGGIDCSAAVDVCGCQEPILGNIIEVATAAGNFTTLLAALDATGLTSTFEGTDEYTVLAPTDDAFTALLATLGIDAPTLLADPGLADILTYHVLAGSVPAAVVVTLTEATTLNGADITITVDGNGDVFINDTVQVTVTDIPASNGIIHVLDGVLLPPDPDACCSVDTAGSCQQVAPSCYDAVVAADPVCANTYDEFCVSCAVDGTSPFADCSGVPAVCGCP